MTNRLLYSYSGTKENKNDRDQLSDTTIHVITLVKFNKQYKPQNNSKKRFLYRVILHLLTLGRARVVVMESSEKELIHYAYVVPKCILYPFLEKNDYEIGPCRTEENYRNRGAYEYVLDRIMKTYGGGVLYMLVEEGNKYSIQGIESSGFVLTGRVRKGLLRWHLNED